MRINQTFPIAAYLHQQYGYMQFKPEIAALI